MEVAGIDIDDLARIVIDGSTPPIDMARAWSKSAGFEPEPATIPEPSAFLEERADAVRAMEG